MLEKFAGLEVSVITRALSFTNFHQSTRIWYRDIESHTPRSRPLVHLYQIAPHSNEVQAKPHLDADTAIMLGLGSIDQHMQSCSDLVPVLVSRWLGYRGSPQHRTFMMVPAPPSPKTLPQTVRSQNIQALDCLLARFRRQHLSWLCCVVSFVYKYR